VPDENPNYNFAFSPFTKLQLSWSSWTISLFDVDARRLSVVKFCIVRNFAASWTRLFFMRRAYKIPERHNFFGFLCSNAWENSCVARMSINFLMLYAQDCPQICEIYCDCPRICHIIGHHCPQIRQICGLSTIWQIYGQNCPQIRQIYRLSTNLSDFWTGLSTNMTDLWLLSINLAYLWAGLSTNLADFRTVSP